MCTMWGKGYNPTPDGEKKKTSKSALTGSNSSSAKSLLKKRTSSNVEVTSSSSTTTTKVDSTSIVKKVATTSSALRQLSASKIPRRPNEASQARDADTPIKAQQLPRVGAEPQATSSSISTSSHQQNHEESIKQMTIRWENNAFAHEGLGIDAEVRCTDDFVFHGQATCGFGDGWHLLRKRCYHGRVVRIPYR